MIARPPRRKQKKNLPSKTPRIKFNNLDEAFPSFSTFLEDAMARSFFKVFLDSKLCSENIIFYEKVSNFQEVESKQTEHENRLLTCKIFREFFEPESTDPNIYVLNVDGALPKELREQIHDKKIYNSSVFKTPLQIVIQHMQMEWTYFKHSPQGKDLLTNLNSDIFQVLPEPPERPPLELPQDFTAKDHPGNWGIRSFSASQ